MIHRISEITPARTTLADPFDPLRMSILTTSNGQSSTTEQALIAIQGSFPIILPTTIEIGIVPIGLTKKLTL